MVLSPKIDLGIINPDENKQWDYAIQNLITIKGVLTGEPSGRPLENIHVRVFEIANLTTHLESGDTVTNAKGEYEMTVSATPGSYHIGPVFDHMDPSKAEKYLSETDSLDNVNEFMKALTAPDPIPVGQRN